MSDIHEGEIVLELKESTSEGPGVFVPLHGSGFIGETGCQCDCNQYLTPARHRKRGETNEGQSSLGQRL